MGFDCVPIITKIVKGCQKMSYFYLLFLSAYTYSLSIGYIFLIHVFFGVLFNPLEFIVFWVAVTCRCAMIYTKRQFNEDFGIEDA
jgi:hypothetical protein